MQPIQSVPTSDYGMIPAVELQYNLDSKYFCANWLHAIYEKIVFIPVNCFRLEKSNILKKTTFSSHRFQLFFADKKKKWDSTLKWHKGGTVILLSNCDKTINKILSI